MKRFWSGTRWFLASAAFLVASLGAASAAQAAVVFDGSPGSGAPPATLGGYTMTPSPQDTRADFTGVTDAPATPASSFSFDQTMQLYTVGQSWGSSNWAGGTYAGRVYYSNGQSSVTITLPSPKNAVYFYATPNQFGTFTMQATASDGTTSGLIPVTTNPGGGPPSGQYFGFYGTAGDKISSVTMTFNDPSAGLSDFAVGDFALSTTGNAVSSTVCRVRRCRCGLVGRRRVRRR